MRIRMISEREEFGVERSLKFVLYTARHTDPASCGHCMHMAYCVFI